VVMIFYNAERFLDEAITSVRAQTYPAWELLLVDDGSAIATSHAADPARIRLLNHPGRANRGMSASSKVADELRQLEYSRRLARGERNVVTHGEATGQAHYAASYRVGQRPTALRPARRRTLSPSTPACSPTARATSCFTLGSSGAGSASSRSGIGGRRLVRGGRHKSRD
jgi:hypothetical protein